MINISRLTCDSLINPSFNRPFLPLHEVHMAGRDLWAGAELTLHLLYKALECPTNIADGLPIIFDFWIDILKYHYKPATHGHVQIYLEFPHWPKMREMLASIHGPDRVAVARTLYLNLNRSRLIVCHK